MIQIQSGLKIKEEYEKQKLELDKQEQRQILKIQNTRPTAKVRDGKARTRK